VSLRSPVHDANVASVGIHEPGDEHAGVMTGDRVVRRPRTAECSMAHVATLFEVSTPRLNRIPSTGRPTRSVR
jgi:hypothetical protein